MSNSHRSCAHRSALLAKKKRQSVLEPTKFCFFLGSKKSFLSRFGLTRLSFQLVTVDHRNKTVDAVPLLLLPLCVYIYLLFSLVQRGRQFRKGKRNAKSLFNCFHFSVLRVRSTSEVAGDNKLRKLFFGEVHSFIYFGSYKNF